MQYKQSDSTYFGILPLLYVQLIYIFMYSMPLTRLVLHFINAYCVIMYSLRYLQGVHYLLHILYLDSAALFFSASAPGGNGSTELVFYHVCLNARLELSH